MSDHFEDQPAPQPVFCRVWGKRGSQIVIGAAVILHVATICYVRWKFQRPELTNPEEYTIGSFAFSLDQPAAKPMMAVGPQSIEVSGVQFKLHITVVSQFAGVVQPRLERRRLRVREAIEQLLRKAHVDDFKDVELVEWKRRCREAINLELGAEAVHEVLVTGLEWRKQRGASDVPIHFDSAQWPGAKQPLDTQ